MYTIGISTFDCTGCKLCTNICPTGAIKMNKIKEKEKVKYDYLKDIEEKHVMDKNSIKGSQFINPKNAIDYDFISKYLSTYLNTEIRVKKGAAYGASIVDQKGRGLFPYLRPAAAGKL